MLLLQRFVPGNVWIVEQKKLRAHLKEIATDIACKCGREETSSPCRLSSSAGWLYGRF